MTRGKRLHLVYYVANVCNFVGFGIEYKIEIEVSLEGFEIMQ